MQGWLSGNLGLRPQASRNLSWTLELSFATTTFCCNSQLSKNNNALAFGYVMALLHSFLLAPPRQKGLFELIISGFMPFLGYHHALMILIVIAIILLCKSCTHIPTSPAFQLPRIEARSSAPG